MVALILAAMLDVVPLLELVNTSSVSWIVVTDLGIYFNYQWERGSEVFTFTWEGRQYPLVCPAMLILGLM